MNLTIPELIYKKRKGFQLNFEEMNTFVKAVVGGNIAEAQTGAMLMAMFLNDLSLTETTNLTKAMVQSGRVFRPRDCNKKLLVDKHSTGGVGDKVSLILAPALAASGLKVPMMSGWSLNHTGGTLDKLQSIPGFQVSLNVDQMNECLSKAGCFISCPSESFAPADKVLYKMRDVTSTVENRGLIASSILSKKIAEGIETLVLDVKYGRGSFSPTEEDAKLLAQTIVSVGNDLNLTVRAVLSEMNAPLGRCVGNALEVVEAVECLRNRENHNNLLQLVMFLGGVTLESTGFAKNLEEGKKIIEEKLKDGTAIAHFKKMLAAQGVIEAQVDALCSGRHWEVLPRAFRTTTLPAPCKGTVKALDSLSIGRACRHLGTSRTKGKARTDFSVGVVLLKSVGDPILEGEPWIEVHHATEVLPLEVTSLLTSSLAVDPDAEERKKPFAMTLFI